MLWMIVKTLVFLKFYLYLNNIYMMKDIKMYMYNKKDTYEYWIIKIKDL